MKAQELDDRFDRGESVVPYLDLTKAVRPGLTRRRVGVDFPDWLLKALDREAAKAGVARQALIKLWLAERVKLEAGE
jgi:hypothetical protein